MAVRKIDSREFEREVLGSSTPAVVDFYADWCGPCHQVSPVVEMLSEEWDGRVRFFKVDIDRNRELAQAYRITSIPAVLLFDEGKPQAWSIGAKPGYILERELGIKRRVRNREGKGVLPKLFRKRKG